MSSSTVSLNRVSHPRTLVDKSSMMVLDAPFVTKHVSLAAASSLTFAAAAASAEAAVSLVVFSAASHAPTLCSKSSMIVACAPFRTSNCSLSATSAFTAAAVSVIVLASEVRVVFSEAWHLPTLDSRSSITVLCAPFFTRHSSFAAKSSLTFAAESALVSASVVRVVCSEDSHFSTFVDKSSITVWWAPFLTKHSAFAAESSLSCCSMAAISKSSASSSKSMVTIFDSTALKLFSIASRLCFRSRTISSFAAARPTACCFSCWSCLTSVSHRAVVSASAAVVTPSLSSKSAALDLQSAMRVRLALLWPTQACFSVCSC